MVASGELKGPVVIGRDHLDSGSVASPNRVTESMRDGSDAVSDWPLLNALLNTASGATWVTLHHSGRSEDHTSELQSLMRTSYDVYCLTNNTFEIVVAEHQKPQTRQNTI